jgi:hypothetical protein
MAKHHVAVRLQAVCAAAGKNIASRYALNSPESCISGRLAEVSISGVSRYFREEQRGCRPKCPSMQYGDMLLLSRCGLAMALTGVFNGMQAWIGIESGCETMWMS